MLHADSFHAGYAAGYAAGLRAAQQQLTKAPKPTSSQASQALADAVAAGKTDFQGVANL